VAVLVDLYLPDQMIRGDLQGLQGRPLDMLNWGLDGCVTLENGCTWSLHTAGGPMRLGTVRVQRDRVLVAIPHDDDRVVDPGIRLGYSEKRQVRVRVGVGPLTVTGDFHVGRMETISIEAIGRGADNRPFVPATRATVQSSLAERWSLESRVVLLARTKISFISLQSDATYPALGVPGSASTIQPMLVSRR
jgi:hypothetical protein